MPESKTAGPLCAASTSGQASGSRRKIHAGWLHSAVMEEFVSESITPHKGTFDAAPMAAGMPGLPSGFDWRGTSYAVVERLETWKQSGAEKGRADGERYLRRHYFRVRM